MIVRSGLQQDFMNMVTILLNRNFADPLYRLSREKGYYARVGAQAEIIDWSKAFCTHYSHLKLSETYNSRMWNAEALEESILLFGRVRFERFCTENANNPSYFLERYASMGDEE